MAKYRKKPQEVEAIQFKDDAKTIEEISNMISGDIRVSYAFPEKPCLHIRKPNCVMAEIGDYIVKESDKCIYACSEEIFKAVYEKVE